MCCGCARQDRLGRRGETRVDSGAERFERAEPFHAKVAEEQLVDRQGEKRRENADCERNHTPAPRGAADLIARTCGPERPPVRVKCTRRRSPLNRAKEVCRDKVIRDAHRRDRADHARRSGARRGPGPDGHGVRERDRGSNLHGAAHAVGRSGSAGALGFRRRSDDGDARGQAVGRAGDILRRQVGTTPRLRRRWRRTLHVRLRALGRRPAGLARLSGR